jgi:hypothetical protein
MLQNIPRLRHRGHAILPRAGTCREANPILRSAPQWRPCLLHRHAAQWPADLSLRPPKPPRRRQDRLLRSLPFFGGSIFFGKSACSVAGTHPQDSLTAWIFHLRSKLVRVAMVAFFLHCATIFVALAGAETPARNSRSAATLHCRRAFAGKRRRPLRISDRANRQRRLELRTRRRKT